MPATELPRALRRRGQELTLREGRALHYQDDPCAASYYLLEGTVRPVKFATDGKSFDLAPIRAGQWIALAELILGRTCLYDAIAAEECRLVSFTASDLAAASSDPDASRAIALALAGEIVLLHRYMADEDAQGKILSFILCRRSLSAVDRRCIRLTQSALAEAVGLTRETVNRQLRDLETRGLVSLGRGEIGVPDWNALESFAAERKRVG